MKASVLIIAVLAATLIPTAHAGTLTVTNTNDNLAGSLRQAIQDAQTGDTIVFNIPTSDPGYNSATKTWTITLTSAELGISKDLSIDGGSQKIIVQRSTAGGTPNFRIFNILAGNVTLSRLTIANGLSQDGTSESKGGGVRNAGTLTLVGSAVRCNTGRFAGGGLYNNGTATVTNCTFNGNSSDGLGGAILNDGNISLTSCTISGNTGIDAPPGIDNAATAHVRNCVIAGNTGGPFADAVGAYVSEGYNFIGRATPPTGDPPSLGSTGFGQPGSHDQVGTSEAPADPKLGPLQNNGGPTFTMAPLGGSPLIDQGNSFGVTTDQRGFPRPLDNPSIANAGGGDGSDIGAVEVDVAQAGPTFVVNTTDEHSDGLCGIADCSLWDAANASNANTSNNSVITFVPGVTGTINVTIQPVGIILVRPVNIVGLGARLLTISAANTGRIFFLQTADVRISGLTIANGNVAAHGAGIFMDTGTSLTLESCAIANNTATGGTSGGGIYNGGTITLNNCTVANNSVTGDGGGIANDGTVTITNSTFSGNNATGNGGGLASTSTTVIHSASFSGNSAGSRGGGARFSSGSVDVKNSILANNDAPNSRDLDQTGATMMADYDLIRDLNGWSFSSQGTHNISGADPMFDPAGLKNNGGPTDTIALLSSSPAVNAGNDGLAPPRDQRGFLRAGTADIGAFEFAGTLPVSLGNISTRGMVGIGDDVMIGGFVIEGSGNKTVLIRAIGPSLANPRFNLTGVLQDPIVSLFDSGGHMIESNDNWGDAMNASSIPTPLQPQNPAESAILTSLAPGAYTAIVSGANGGTGLGLVEVFDRDATVPVKLGNISTRGLAGTGDSVLIGGFIVTGADNETVVIRAIGPSLAQPPFNLTNVLQNPTLSLFNDQGQRIQFNDDWQTDQKDDIIATGLQPSNTAESAILTTLMPGNYTAIVSGLNGTTGLSLVEIFSRN